MAGFHKIFEENFNKFASFQPVQMNISKSFEIFAQIFPKELIKF